MKTEMNFYISQQHERLWLQVTPVLLKNKSKQ